MTIAVYKLTVECEPEINASIFINDADTLKKTPYTFELPSGVYKVKLILPPGYFFK